MKQLSIFDKSISLAVDADLFKRYYLQCLLKIIISFVLIMHIFCLQIGLLCVSTKTKIDTEIIAGFIIVMLIFMPIEVNFVNIIKQNIQNAKMWKRSYLSNISDINKQLLEDYNSHCKLIPSLFPGRISYQILPGVSVIAVSVCQALILINRDANSNSGSDINE